MPQKNSDKENLQLNGRGIEENTQIIIAIKQSWNRRKQPNHNCNKKVAQQKKLPTRNSNKTGVEQKKSAQS